MAYSLKDKRVWVAGHRGMVGAAMEPVVMPVRRDLAAGCMETPAPTTLLYVPRQMETRVAAILVRVTQAVIRAHAESGPKSQELGTLGALGGL